MNAARPRITVAVPYQVYPPRTGGQDRVFFFWRGVADAFDVELVTLGEPSPRPLEVEVAPGMREIRVPKPERYMREERRLTPAATRAPVADVAAAVLLEHAPDYRELLARSLAGAALGVASHPFCIRALRDSCGDLPLVYEAHNVEAHLKTATLGADLGRVAREAEADACAAARLVIACSTDDATELARLYGVDAARLHVAPNGIDTKAIAVSDPAGRAARRHAVDIDGTRIAMFVGSRHPPNVDAGAAILELAPALPDVTFLLVGSHCAALADRPRPRNVALMGVVDRATLAAITAVADVALNPMRTGSGTNLKIAASLAAGVPVVTTPVGARGYDLVDGRHAVVCPLEEFARRVRALLDDAGLAARIGAEGRRLVETHYDWDAIAAGVVPALARIIAEPPRSRSWSARG